MSWRESRAPSDTAKEWNDAPRASLASSAATWYAAAPACCTL